MVSETAELAETEVIGIGSRVEGEVEVQLFILDYLCCKRTSYYITQFFLWWIVNNVMWGQASHPGWTITASL